MNLSPILRVMTDAATKAGRGLIRDFGEIENLQVSPKGTSDFTTSADLRSEKTIYEMLSKARPDYAFLMEESGERPGKNGSEYRWVVDPLDGTANFLHGLPHFCISIGLERFLPDGGSEITAGVIFDPLRNEMYWGEKGGGAFCNNRRIRVSAREKLQQAMIASESPGRANQGDGGYLAKLQQASKFAFGLRCTGSAALDLAYLASGKYDGFWRSRIKAWDIAAGIVLVKEAGGGVSELHSGTNVIHGGTLIASNGHLHKTIDQTLSGALNPLVA